MPHENTLKTLPTDISIKSSMQNLYQRSSLPESFRVHEFWHPISTPDSCSERSLDSSLPTAGLLEEILAHGKPEINVYPPGMFYSARERSN